MWNWLNHVNFFLVCISIFVLAFLSQQTGIGAYYLVSIKKKISWGEDSISLQLF